MTVCTHTQQVKTYAGHHYILSEDDENHRRVEILHVTKLPLSLRGLSTQRTMPLYHTCR